MLDDPRLAGHRTYYVRVYRDGHFGSWVFGDRFPVPRQALVAEETTNLNHEDPRSIMDALIKAVKFDRYRGKLSSLVEYSIDIWVPDEYGTPGATPLVRNFRYTPDMRDAESSIY